MDMDIDSILLEEGNDTTCSSQLDTPLDSVFNSSITHAYLDSSPDNDASTGQIFPEGLQEPPDDLAPGLIIKSNHDSHIYHIRKSAWTFEDVFTFLADLELLDPSKTKIIIKGKQYRPGRDGHRLVCDFNGMKGTVYGSNTFDLEALKESRRRTPSRPLERALLKLAPKPAAETKPQNTSPYTFDEIRSLEWLPNSDQAKEMLEKLKNDFGIQRAMLKNKLQVKLLTEMEPLSNTSVSADGRTTRLLGLNRNAGEVIELRLRTDNHRGFRNYKTVRKTLCHELAHNRFSQHTQDFWRYCTQLEREVDGSNSYRTLDGMRGVVGDVDRLQFEAEREAVDDGVVNGEWELGTPGQGMVTSREVRARAVERRLKAEEEKRRRENQS